MTFAEQALQGVWGWGRARWSGPGLTGVTLSSATATTSHHRPSMSGLDLAKRSHRKMDLQRDFSVASPAEFVTRFGGNRVIEKVCPHTSLLVPGQGLTAFHRDTFEHCPNVLCPPGSEQWQPRAVHSMASLAPMRAGRGIPVQQLCTNDGHSPHLWLSPVPDIRDVLEAPRVLLGCTTRKLLLCSTPTPCPCTDVSRGSKGRVQPVTRCPCPRRCSSPTMALQQ